MQPLCHASSKNQKQVQSSNVGTLLIHVGRRSLDSSRNLPSQVFGEEDCKTGPKERLRRRLHS